MARRGRSLWVSLRAALFLTRLQSNALLTWGVEVGTLGVRKGRRSLQDEMPLCSRLVTRCDLMLVPASQVCSGHCPPASAHPDGTSEAWLCPWLTECHSREGNSPLFSPGWGSWLLELLSIHPRQLI